MATDKGVKLDGGKVRMDLLPMEQLEAIAEVLTFGANKYTENGWQEVDNGYERYRAGLLRHMVAKQKGEFYDPESGLPHDAHIACNAVFMLYFSKQQEAILEARN